MNLKGKYFKIFSWISTLQFVILLCHYPNRTKIGVPRSVQIWKYSICKADQLVCFNFFILCRFKFDQTIFNITITRDPEGMQVIKRLYQLIINLNLLKNYYDFNLWDRYANIQGLCKSYFFNLLLYYVVTGAHRVTQRNVKNRFTSPTTKQLQQCDKISNQICHLIQH